MTITEKIIDGIKHVYIHQTDEEKAELKRKAEEATKKAKRA